LSWKILYLIKAGERMVKGVSSLFPVYSVYSAYEDPATQVGQSGRLTPGCALASMAGQEGHIGREERRDFASWMKQTISVLAQHEIPTSFVLC